MSDIIDIFELYSSEITDRLLTADEEKDYARRYKEEQDAEAFHILIIHNLRLVRFIAYRFAKRGHNIQDLVQAGNIGLMIAIDKFDYNKGYRLSTYAVWWIRQSMQKYINYESYSIKVPTYLIEKYRHLHQNIENFIAENYRDPTMHEIFQMMGGENQFVVMSRQALLGTLSLNGDVSTKDNNNYINWSDTLLSNDDVEKDGMDLFLSEEIDILKKKILTDREYTIISMRYGAEPKTFEEVGFALGLSKTRIRQIELRALRKMRQDLDMRKIWREFRPA